jgi:hypothetical protein
MKDRGSSVSKQITGLMNGVRLPIGTVYFASLFYVRYTNVFNGCRELFPMVKRVEVSLLTSVQCKGYE